MAGVILRRGPAELADALAALEVHIDSAQVEQAAVPLPDYPGGPRPSSVLRLTGGGHVGCGEHVAFSEGEHAEFAVRVAAWFRPNLPSAVWCVRSARGFPGTAYERAALEAALIDLALGQRGLSLYDLTGKREAPLRFVASFAASADPELQIQNLRSAGYTGELKVDVDPSWSGATLGALAREPSIAVLDFKSRAEPRLAQQLSALLPQALLEDPPAGFEAVCTKAERARISRDARLSDANAVAAAVLRGEAVNLKAPRMSGPLELLRGLEFALQPSAARQALTASGTAPRVTAYLGGMFEVGVGRSQARQLAALYCADAPNDLAPNIALTVPNAPRANSPTLVRLDQPGFGRAS